MPIWASQGMFELLFETYICDTRPTWFKRGYNIIRAYSAYAILWVEKQPDRSCLDMQIFRRTK